MIDWDWEENEKLGFFPDKITEGSHKKACWICCIHKTKYVQVVRDKCNGQVTCKECFEIREFEQRRKRYIGNKKVLAETHPHLIKEWVSCEDEKITPYNCVAGSSKKVVWKCNVCGGQYEAYISNRALKGTGCRYCAGQDVLIGYNDFKTTHPEIASEWSTKNIVSPLHITYGSNKKVYWICRMGHKDYLMSVKTRVSGQGCPICAQQSQTSFPEQALFFYIKKVFPDALNRYIFEKKYEMDIFIPSKNIGIEYNGYFSHKGKEQKDKLKKEKMISVGINMIVIKEYNTLEERVDAEYFVHQRTKPEDLNNLIKDVIFDIYGEIDFEINISNDMIKIKEQYIVTKTENSIASLRPDLVKEWDFVNNGNITPDLVTVGSTIKYFWICPVCHKSYLCAPKNKTRGSSCPFHREKKVCKGINDFGSMYPELLKFWDYEKNTKKPYEVYHNSRKIYNWKCDKGHSFTSSIVNTVKRKGCPICSGRRVLEGENDLLSQRPEIVLDWNYELNDCNPNEVHYKNQTKLIHWTCHKCGFEWQSKISSRAMCPNCKKMKTKINVYYLADKSFYDSFENIQTLCNHFGIEYSKQHGNISSICNRKQKSLFGKYILRYDFDDEIKK